MLDVFLCIVDSKLLMYLQQDSQINILFIFLQEYLLLKLKHYFFVLLRCVVNNRWIELKVF